MKVKYDNIVFDSQEEVDFYIWLQQAKDKGYVIEETYHPPAFILSDKIVFPREISVAGISKFIAIHKGRSIRYNPDWYVVFSDSFLSQFDHGLISSKFYDQFWIDVKGSTNVGVNNNSSFYTFPIKQAWVYQKYNIYVNKVRSASLMKTDKQTHTIKITKPGFFSKTWLPNELAWDKRRKLPVRIKKYSDCNNLK